MSADSLSSSSRSFYERSKGKLNLSLVLAAASMMLLGFCAIAGGEAASETAFRAELKATYSTDDEVRSSNAKIAGYGFACFTYIVGFFLLASSAIYVSPLFCGTNNEMKTIRAPLEVNGGGGGGGYSGEPYNRSVPVNGDKI